MKSGMESGEEASAKSGIGFGIGALWWRVEESLVVESVQESGIELCGRVWGKACNRVWHQSLV